MFILKPLKSILFSSEDVGTVEDVVRETRLVDKGVEELKRFSRNAPSFEPERRKFLKHVAVLAGLYAGGQLLKGCATAQESAQFQGKTYSDWEAYLLSQDLIRGPEPLYRPTGDLPYDNHLNRTGWYSIDYDVPIGTPIVPTADTYSSHIPIYAREGGNVLYLLHRGPYHRTEYAHLDKHADIVYKGKPVSRGGRPFIDNELSKLKVVAYSGNTGIGPGGGVQRPHLHFGVYSTTNNQIYSIDPFTLGIDTEKTFDEYPKGRRVARPVYWDSETEIPHRAKDKKAFLKKSLDTLAERLKQSDLDQAAKKDILDRQNKPEDLRDYLGMRVLQKKPGPDGKPRYEFMPGSLMYGLMLEFYGRSSKEGFIAMLPFIFPPLKPVYQKANPGVQF